MSNLHQSPRTSRLRHLSIQGCKKISTIGDLGKTIVSLDITGCVRMTDATLLQARKLRLLKCGNVPNVTTTLPFSKTLIVLEAGGTSGIRNEGLSSATQIKCLYANMFITNLEPFARSLLELHLAPCSKITDADLKNAINLRIFSANDSNKITTVAPFAKTLRVLNLYNVYTINDHGMVGATSLVELALFGDVSVRTIKPFAKTLRMLKYLPYAYSCDSRFSKEFDLSGAESLTILDIFELSFIKTPLKPIMTARVLYTSVRESNKYKHVFPNLKHFIPKYT